MHDPKVDRPRRLPPAFQPPEVWLMDATPDGFAEVTLEMHGVILWTWVVPPDMGYEEAARLQADIRRTLERRC